MILENEKIKIKIRTEQVKNIIIYKLSFKMERNNFLDDNIVNKLGNSIANTVFSSI